MSSSDEEDEKLKAALDPSLMNSGLYSKSEKCDQTETESNGITNKSGPKEKVSQPVKQKQKSLRRDLSEAESERAVMSELEVTPQFQAYVAKQLDLILGQSIEEVQRNETINKKLSEELSSIKLLNKSVKPVRLREDAARNMKRPNLLQHRNFPDADSLDSKDLAGVTMTTQQILDKVGTEHYANRFAGRVEEGIARIKKKKKKLKKNKKKKKKDTSDESTTKPESNVDMADEESESDAEMEEIT